MASLKGGATVSPIVAAIVIILVIVLIGGVIYFFNNRQEATPAVGPDAGRPMLPGPGMPQGQNRPMPPTPGNQAPAPPPSAQ